MGTGKFCGSFGERKKHYVVEMTQGPFIEVQISRKTNVNRITEYTMTVSERKSVRCTGGCLAVPSRV